MFTTVTGNSTPSKSNGQTEKLSEKSANKGYWDRGVSVLTSFGGGVAGKAASAFNSVTWGLSAPLRGAKAVISMYQSPVSYLLECFKNGITGKEPISNKSVKRRLKELDPTNRLPIFSQTLAKFVIEKIHRSKANFVIKPYDSQEGIENKKNEALFYADENGDLQLCLTFIIHRAIAYLACCQPANEKGEINQLFANVLKNLFDLLSKSHSENLQISLKNYFTIHAKLKACDSEKESLNEKIADLITKRKECNTALKSLEISEKDPSLYLEMLQTIEHNLQAYKNLQTKYNEYLEEYYSSDANFMYTHALMDEQMWLQFMHEKDPTTLSKLKSPSSLEKKVLEKRDQTIKLFKPLLKELCAASGFDEDFFNILLEGGGMKGGYIESALKWLAPSKEKNDGSIASMVFNVLLKQCESLLDSYAAAQSEFYKPDLQKASQIDSMVGHSEFKEDVTEIIQKILPSLFSMLKGHEIQSMLAHTIKDNLDEQEIPHVERKWIEQVFTLCTDVEKPYGSALRKLIESLVAPRLFFALEKAALFDKNSQGTFFNKIITNIINVLKKSYQQYAGQVSLEQANFLYQALQWRNKYLVGKKGISQEQCDREAIHLTKQEIDRIYQLAGYSSENKEYLKQSILTLSGVSEEQFADLECSFFQGTTLKEAEKTIKEMETNFYQPILEFDRWNLIIEALTWRGRYLREEKGVDSKQCDSQASYLTSEDIAKIYEMAGYTGEQKHALLKAMAGLNGETSFENVEEAELVFFQKESLSGAINKKQQILDQTFVPAAENLLGLLGLASDADFALPGATGNEEALYTLDALRKSLLPTQLLELYRHMSGFYGNKSEVAAEGGFLFGSKAQALKGLATVLAHTVLGSTKSYLKDNSDTLANQIHAATGYFPASKEMIATTIEEIAGETFSTTKANGPALKDLYGHLEQTIQVCLMKVLITFAEKYTPQQEEKSPSGTYRDLIAQARSMFLNTSSKEEAKSSSELLAAILSSLAGLFSRHRKHLKKGMKEHEIIVSCKDKAKKLTGRENPEEQKKLQGLFDKLLPANIAEVFAPLVKELLATTGLTVKDLGLPVQVQEIVWAAIQDQLQSNLAAIYTDLTAWEREQEQTDKKLKDLGVLHGSGAAAGVAHYGIKIVQSMLAVDNQVFWEGLYPSIVDFFKDSQIPEGKFLAEALESNETCVKENISHNLSIAARDKGVKNFLQAVEKYLQPILQRTILALGDTFKKVEGHNRNILKKIAYQVVLVTGDHFKKIQAVALRENKKQPFHVEPLKMLEGVTSDEHVLGYVFLSDKVKKAKSILREKRQNYNWTITKNGASQLLTEIARAEKYLKKAKKNLESYANAKWSDGGIAVENYLHAEHTLRIREEQLGAAQQYLRQRWENLIHRSNPLEIKEVKIARQHCREARKHLNKMKQVLEAVDRQSENVQNYLDLKVLKEAAVNPLEKSIIRQKIKRFIDNRWSDGGKALKSYLKAYRNYCMLNEEFLSAQKQVKSSASYIETDQIKAIRQKRDLEKSALAQLAIDLENAVCIRKAEVHKASGKGKLINLCLEAEYKNLEEKLAKAQNASEKQKAQEEFDNYCLKMYFKPLTKKILNFIDEEQFDNYPFPELLKPFKGEVLKLAKTGILPSILGNIINTLCKPETLLGIVLTAVKNLNQSVEHPAMQAADRPPIEPDEDFDNECGKMIMEFMEMGVLGFEKDLLSVIKVVDIQGSAGKALGAALREFISQQSLVGLLDAGCEAGPTSLLPESHWGSKGEFHVSEHEKKFPQTLDELQAAKTEELANIQKIEKEFRQELAKLAENNIKTQLASFFSTFAQPWNNFRANIHDTLDNISHDISEVFQIDCQDFFDHLKADIDTFADKFYAIIVAVANLIASIIFWPALRFFYMYLRSKGENLKNLISMGIHKRLIFQAVNVFVGSIEGELETMRNQESRGILL